MFVSGDVENQTAAAALQILNSKGLGALNLTHATKKFLGEKA
jgi:hypothetical protein